jgi:hypothetical protein
MRLDTPRPHPDQSQLRCSGKMRRIEQKMLLHLLSSISSFISRLNIHLQEAIVVIKDIFRKYPNKYESIIATLCENLDTLDEPEAR